MPKVSVIIPNYNHARYLPQRISTVLEQTWEDMEVLLLDDASTDESRRVIRDLAAGDPRVRILFNETNSGSGYRQWNKGAREATGEYIWIAESDDYADPRLLERLVACLEANPAVGVAYCQSWRVDAATGRRYNNREWTLDLGADRWEADFVANGKEECRRFLCLKNTIPNASAVVFRRGVFNEVGGVPEDMRLCADWMLWLQMLWGSDLAYVAEPLNYFRLDSGSVTQRTKRDGTNAEEAYDVALWMDKNLGILPERRESVCDKMFYVWTHPQLRDGSRYGFRRNARIYRKARSLDRNLDRRLLKRLAQYGVEKFPALLAPARFARRALGGRP
jgi:glycosyltransferase involved in cell wall biosynthesis